MGSGKYFVSVPIKFDVDDELEELRKKLEKVVSDASSEMTGELGDGFKSLESNIKDIKKAIDALGKTQAGSSEYEKAIKSLQTQFDELSKRIDDINKKIKSFSSSGATAGEIDNVSNSLDSLNKSIKDTANSVSSLYNSSGSFKTNLKDNLEETKKEAKETAAAMKEVADGVKVYKNQVNSTTTNKKGKKQQALSWTEFTDFFQTVTKNATVKPDGTLNIISEKVRTNYEALEKEITKVDKKIIDLMFDMGKQGDETSASTGKQIDLLREYLALLERTRNKQISSPAYLADQGHAQTIDFVRGKVQVAEYNSEITKVAKTIDSLREKIANVDKAGISSDYAQDLDNADKSLENLAQDLQDFFNQIKANNGQISDVEFFKFFNNYKKVMSSVDDTLGFAKVDKQIAKLKNDLIEINTAIASSGKNTDVSALERKRDELEKTVNALVSARNAELQLTGASANSYDNATASIAKYNEEIISATESLSKMREKISSLMADESRSAAFKSELSNLSNDIRLAGKELDDAFILLKQNPFDTNNLNSFRIALAKVTETTEQYNKLVANSTTSKAYAATREDVQKLDNQISAFLDQNTAAANRFKQELLAIQAALRGSLANGVDMSKFDLSTYSEQVNRIQSEVKSLHQTGNSFFTSLKKQLQSANAQFIGTYLSIQDFIRYGKEIFDTVKNIDSALTELRKVSDATTERLVENFETSAKTAKELGDSVKDVINMTADWARLGYDVDAAEELARVTTLFKNVGDDMSAETASEYMISALQGFQIAAEDAERIVDAYNEVANNYAIDTAGIGEALERSAASFNAANTSMEKAIALVTATNEVVQNPESVGTLWKTMSARIRGAKTELEELGEEEDQFTQTTSKLRDLVMGLTGFDILEEDGETFKDIYEIILGIGKEWDKLTDIEQASLGEALAGKRNANAFYAVIGNLETLQEAYETASNSAGSAAKEQENFAKSIQYSLNKLEASFEVLAADLLDSQFAKGLVEFLTSIVNFLDAIVENVGVLIPLLTTLGGLSIIKNIDNIRGLIDLGKSLTAIEEATKLLDPLLAAGAATDVLANSLKGLTIEQSANLLASKGLTKAKIEEILVSQGADIEIAKETALRATLTNTTVTQTKSTISLSAAYKGLAASLGISTAALTAFIGVAAGLTLVASAVYEVYKANKEAAESAKELGNEFSNTQSDIESYKKKVDSLRDTINNSTDYDVVRSAREELYEIQKQMIEAYGDEAGKVVDLTNTLKDQKEAWDALTESQWKNTLNSFNANKELNPFDDINYAWNGVSDKVELMLKEMENTKIEIGFSMSDKDLANEIAEKYNLNVKTYDNRRVVELSGNLYEVQERLLEIQDIVKSTDGVTQTTLNELTSEANSIQSTLDSYEQFYKQYVYFERILKNSDYKEYFDKVKEAYEEFEDAYINGDVEAQKAAILKIAEYRQEAYASMFNDDKLIDAEEQSVLNFVDDLIPLIQNELSAAEFQINIEANTNNMTDRITEALSQFDDLEHITSEFSLLMSPDKAAAWQTLTHYAKKYNLTVQELVDLLAKLGVIEVDYDVDVPKEIREEVDKVNKRLEISDETFSELEIHTEEEYQLWLDVATGCKTATEAVKKYKDAVAEVAAEANSFEFNSLTDTIEDVNEKLLPQFEKLGELYDEIFNGDNGFDLSGIGADELFEISEAFSNLDAALGIEPPTDAVNEFLHVIGNSSSTIDQVENSFDALATAYFNAAVNAGNFSEENAAVMEQMLKEMGIVNADKVVDYYTTLAEAQKLVADNGWNLVEADKAMIDGWVEAVGASEETANALYILALKQIFLNENWVNEENSIAQVLALADAAGIATEAVGKLGDAQANISSLLADLKATNDPLKQAEIANDIKEAREDAKAYAEEIQNEVNNFSIDFSHIGSSSGSKGSAGSAGKEDGEDYVDAFEKALEELEKKRDAGILTEREFLQAYRDLIEEFYGASMPISAEELKEAQDYADALDEIYRSYNGIDNMNRDFIAWDEDTVKKYSDFVIEQFGSIEEGMEQLEGTWSTVMGGVENIDDVKIAFSNLLQTDHGLVPLTSDVLWDYIEDIYKKAIDENGVFDVEKFVQLDKEGSDREIYGQVEHVANMIAAAEGQVLNGIKITADDVIAIGTPGEDLSDDIESIFKGFSMHDIHANTILNSYARFLGQMEGMTEEFVERMHDYFERLTTYYESVISAINTILSHRISNLQDSKSKAIDAINKEKEAAAESYQAQIDYIDSLIDAKEAEIDAIDDEIDKYQEQIDAIDKQIDALEEANQKRQQALNLQKAQYELEKAQNQKTKMVYQNGQLVYTQDTGAIRDARENLEDAEFEIQKQKLEDLKKPLQEQIDLLEKRKKLIQDEIDDLQKQQDAIQKALEASNKYYEKLAKETEAYWDALIEKLEKTKSKFEELAELKELAEAYALVKEYCKETEYSWEDLVNGNEEAIAKLLSDYEQALLMANIDNENFAEALALAEQDMVSSFGNISSSASDTKAALDPLTEALKPFGDATSEISDTADALGEVATNSEKAASNTKDVATNATTAASALDEEAKNADSAYDSLDKLSDLNLATVITQMKNLADAIKDVATALGLTEDSPISAIETAITNLSQMSLGEESTGIIGSFNSLKTAVEGVTSAIGSGGGASSGEADMEAKSAGMDEGANDGGSGGLIGAIGELHTATDEHIGTSAEDEGSEEGGTVISDFNALKAAVEKVAETIGLAGENGEAPEGSLLGIIQTMPDVSEEPINTVKEFFNELCKAISDCVTAVGELLDGISQLGGAGFSISSSGGGIYTGNVHIGEATGNVHAGNAYASGKLGIKKSENALVGEIGRELVYNPATGTYRTVGDHGPEITRLNKGDLIFNAEQTKAIIKHGKRDHGHSYAGGNSEFMPLTSAEIEMFKKMGSAVEGIKADVDQMLEPVKSLTRGATYNTTNNNPVINISDTHFDIQGVTGEQVARQISDTFEGMISHAYQRAMKK